MDFICKKLSCPFMLGNLEHALHSLCGSCLYILTARHTPRRCILGTRLHIWINNVKANKISERKWWLSLITNLKQQRTILSNTFISHKTIYHTQYRPDEKEGGSNPPSFSWCAKRESNPRPTYSEYATLSTELLAHKHHYYITFCPTYNSQNSFFL